MSPFAHLKEGERWSLTYDVLELRGPATALAKKNAKKK
jgi:hypothetical protein